MGQLLYLICNKNKKHEKGFLLGTGMLPKLYTDTVKKNKKRKIRRRNKKVFGRKSKRCNKL